MRSKNEFTHHPTPCKMRPLHHGIQQTVSKMGPTIIMGSTKAQGLEAKPTSRVRATQSNESKGRSNTKGGQQMVHSEPHRGDPHPQASYMGLDWEVSFTLSVWAGTERSGFSR
jgi:hypothetical protein